MKHLQATITTIIALILTSSVYAQREADNDPQSLGYTATPNTHFTAGPPGVWSYSTTAIFDPQSTISGMCTDLLKNDLTLLETQSGLSGVIAAPDIVDSVADMNNPDDFQYFLAFVVEDEFGNVVSTIHNTYPTASTSGSATWTDGRDQGERFYEFKTDNHRNTNHDDMLSIRVELQTTTLDGIVDGVQVAVFTSKQSYSENIANFIPAQAVVTVQIGDDVFDMDRLGKQWFAAQADQTIAVDAFIVATTYLGIVETRQHSYSGVVPDE